VSCVTARAAITAFDIVECGDVSELVSKHGKHVCDCITFRELPCPQEDESEAIRIPCVTMDGEEYEACAPSHGCCSLSGLLGRLLRFWASKHYKLSTKQQRQYLAYSMGMTFDLLLVKSNSQGIPADLHGIICLMSIAIRRVEQSGNQVDLNKAASRRHVLQEIQAMLDFKYSKKLQMYEAGTLAKEPTSFKRRTFMFLEGTVEKPDFTLTAEEIVSLNYRLQRSSAETINSILATCLEMIQNAHEECDNMMAAKAAEKEASEKMPHMETGWPFFVSMPCYQATFCTKPLQEVDLPEECTEFNLEASAAL
jgi:hypothetical protein